MLLLIFHIYFKSEIEISIIISFKIEFRYIKQIYSDWYLIFYGFFQVFVLVSTVSVFKCVDCFGVLAEPVLQSQLSVFQ